MSMLDKAIAIAAYAFQGQFDKGGQPYILHCLAVMYGVDQSDPELMSIAVLHDLVEDTKYYVSDLFDQGFSERVILGVQSMTRGEGESYSAYIKRVAANPDAVHVKMADLRHNSDITRIPNPTHSDIRRVQKYKDTLLRLQAVLKELD